MINSNKAELIAEYNSSEFNEDEILSRFKVVSRDIGDKVISLSEDVLLTCDSWSDPRSNIEKLEEAMHDPRKKHVVFYDLWHDSVVRDILVLFRKYRHRCWSSIEFRGCQEKHINAVLECALKMDIVQTIAFSLTSSRHNPARMSTDSTFDLIASSIKNNRRLECLIFHSRPMHFIRYESLKNIPIKRLHFLDGTTFHPTEISQLAEALRLNHSLLSFTFLGEVQASNGTNVSCIVDALKSHPSLKRLVLCLKSAAIDGLHGLPDLLRCQNSKLESLALAGGFTTTVFVPPATFSEGLTGSNLKHLHLKDILLFPSDIEDVAAGLKNNHSIESLSIELGVSNRSIVPCNEAVDVSPIAVALQNSQTIQRLALSGMYSLGSGICGISKLLSSKKSNLKNLHLSGVFFEKDLRHEGFVQIFVDGLLQNQRLESLDLSNNALSDCEVSMIYEAVSTCHSLHNLDLVMNDITSKVLGTFAKHKTPNKLAVLRVSSPNFSFFDMNDKVCRQLVTLLTTNPRLGDVNFNIGSAEWHQSYQANGKMKWHHFFPSFLIYNLYFNNKRVHYLRTRLLTESGRSDLSKIQYLLDYNWAGRSLVSCSKDHRTIPIALWPKIMERIWKGRTCFWTGREQGSQLESAHSVTYSFLRENLVTIFKANGTIPNATANQRTKRKIASNDHNTFRKIQKT